MLKKFEGKTIDEAIEAACSFFGTDKNSLEIEIEQESSNGIFGLGTKKAVILAKRRSEKPHYSRFNNTNNNSKHSFSDLGDEDDYDEMEENGSAYDRSYHQEIKIENPEKLTAFLKETVASLLKPITTNYELEIDLAARPISVRIDDPENSGLIIGREGQTIAALQYVMNRIIANKWNYMLRVQLDTGDYRQKQQEKLVEIALSLAEKCKITGRPYSTRPLSSFYRRVVHVALQNDRGIFTRSKGDGPMKRVLILPKKDRY